MIKCNLRYLMADRKIDDIVSLMRLSGLSRNSINKLFKEESMESLKLETLFKLCDTFECKLSELLEYIPEDADKKLKD